jgi:CRP/FNR family transcriptional regulator, cyclic AMP receptor protein
LDWIDWIGVFAGVFVVLAFYARRPARLRVLAIASNVLFITYAALAGLWPVLALHAVLLPLNLVRLREGWKAGVAAR